MQLPRKCQGTREDLPNAASKAHLRKSSCTKLQQIVLRSNNQQYSTNHRFVAQASTVPARTLIRPSSGMAFNAAKQLVVKVSEGCIELANSAAQLISKAWSAHKPTTLLGWTVRINAFEPSLEAGKRLAAACTWHHPCMLWCNRRLWAYCLSRWPPSARHWWQYQACWSLCAGSALSPTHSWVSEFAVGTAVQAQVNCDSKR